MSNWWDKNVKQRLKNIGGSISKASQKVTDALGLSTPDLPEGSQPVVDQAKVQDLATYQGINRQNVNRWGTNTPGGPGYYAAETFTPVQSQQIDTPTAEKEAALTYTDQRSAAPTEQSLAPLSLQRYGNSPINLTSAGTIDRSTLPSEGQTNLNLGRVSGISPDTETYQTAAKQALAERVATSAPSTEGYDPSRKALALQQLTAGLDTQQKDAEAKLTEQLQKAGILNSSVGQAQLAKLRQSYDQQKSQALTQVNLEDLAAARTDRYANAEQAASRLNQISNLASSGQGMGLQSGTFKAGLTAQDNQAIQAEANNLMTQRGIDRDTAMQIATYNRESTNQNNQNALTQESLRRGAIEQGNAATTNEAQYGRSGRQIDTQTASNLAQQNFGNRMTTENYNRQGRQMGTDQGWNTYNAQQADAVRRAGVINEAGLYNIGARQTAKANEANSYLQDLNNLAQGTSGSIYTPQSQAAADTYAAKKQLQNQNLQNTMEFVKTASSLNRTPQQGQTTAATNQNLTPVQRQKNLISMRSR